MVSKENTWGVISSSETDGLYFVSETTNGEHKYTSLFAYPAPEDSYDKTDFQSGLTMGLIGKGSSKFIPTDSFARGYSLGAELKGLRNNPIPMLSSSDSWFRQGTTIRDSITEIRIVDSYTPTGDEKSSWKCDYNREGHAMCYLKGTVLTLAGNGSGKIVANADSSKLFEGFKNTTSIKGLDLLDTREVKNFARVFYGCHSLKNVDVSTFSTSNATTMERMFFECKAFTSLDLSNFSTKNVTNMDHMFYGCVKLKALNVTSFHTENVENMCKMFFECNSLVDLDVSAFNTSKVTTMDHMFARCNVLPAVNLLSFNTSKVTSFYYMFENCYQLTLLDLRNFNTSKVTSATGMFNGCSKLTAIYVGDGWDMSNANTEVMFGGCGVSSVSRVSNNS